MIRSGLLALACVSAWNLTFASLAWSAEITGYPPMEPQIIFGSASYIFVNGEIDKHTAGELERYISDHNVKELSAVYLNSPGGDLLAGINVGRVLRKNRLIANVGSPPLPGKKRFDVQPGYCFSACSLAYLGGLFRYLNKNSQYGVHRFYFTEPGSDDADIAQILSAAIVNYLQEMGIDSKFFAASTNAGKDSIFQPSRTELESWGVVNNGFTEPSWTIESNDGALYLKGERQTVYGINKFMFLCSDGKLVLYIIFDPQGRDNEVIAFAAHSLVTDDITTPLTPAFKFVDNGWFNAAYDLTNHQWGLVRRAEFVGVMVQAIYNAPVFLGFDKMPFAKGRAMLPGLEQNCR